MFDLKQGCCLETVKHNAAARVARGGGFFPFSDANNYLTVGFGDRRAVVLVARLGALGVHRKLRVASFGEPQFWNKLPMQ